VVFLFLHLLFLPFLLLLFFFYSSCSPSAIIDVLASLVWPCRRDLFVGWEKQATRKHAVRVHAGAVEDDSDGGWELALGRVNGHRAGGRPTDRLNWGPRSGRILQRTGKKIASFVDIRLEGFVLTIKGLCRSRRRWWRRRRRRWWWWWRRRWIAVPVIIIMGDNEWRRCLVGNLYLFKSIKTS